jgi:predicted outer membrane repeat protein
MTTLCWFLINSATAATITVATDGSGDYAQIQDAIDAATSGDTLQLGAGEWNAPFDFSGKDLTVKGEGREETLIDGRGEYDVLIVATAGEHIQFEQLTLSNSYHQGIILDGGSLTADDVLFDDLGSQEDFGGAIYATEADLTITNSRFFENYGYDGGAIHASGSMSIFIEDTSFESNRAYGYTERVIEYEYDEETGEEISSTTLVWERQGQGGVLLATGSGSITIMNSEFVDNRSYWAGGALAIRTFDGTVAIDNSLFEGNRSVRSSGGAIANWMNGEDVYELDEFAELFNTLLIDNCEFFGNLAQRSSGGALYTEGDFSGPIRVEINTTDFSYNEASSDGGAIWAKRMYDEILINESTFDLNEGRSGGALGFNQQILFTGTNLDISSNTASSNGGGIYASDAVMVLLVDSKVRGNRSKSSQGGGIYAGSLTESYPAKFVRVTVADNSSVLEGGGIFVRGVENTTIEESLLEGNEAGSNSFGGGLYADDSAYVKIRNSVLRSNTAHYGGGAYINDNADGSDFFNNVFLDNDARTGGGFALCNSPYTLFYNNTVAGNHAMFESSGAAFYNSQVDFRNNIFAHNLGGAALHMYDLNSAFYAELSHNNFYDNDPLDIGGDLEPSVLDSDGNMALGPQFSHYAPGMPGDEASVVLALTSPLIDAGDPLILDWDGTDSDVGAFGGDYLIVNDKDADGYLSNVDCDDEDPSVHPGAEEVWYDGLNSDCAFSSDFDADGDGVEHPSSGTGTDCDDTDASKSLPEDCPPPPDDDGDDDDNDEVTPEEAPGVSTSGKVGCAVSPGEKMPIVMILFGFIGVLSRRIGSES